jgi:hypothetical protein
MVSQNLLSKRVGAKIFSPGDLRSRFGTLFWVVNDQVLLEPPSGTTLAVVWCFFNYIGGVKEKAAFSRAIAFEME